jgi:hypothetical protein
MQEIADPAQIMAARAERHYGFIFRDRRQVEVAPAALLKQMTD